jgi:hypothetical protein
LLQTGPRFQSKATPGAIFAQQRQCIAQTYPSRVAGESLTSTER